MIVKFVSDAKAGLAGVADGLTNVGNKAEAAETHLRAINIVMASIAVNKAIEWGNSFLQAAENIDSLRTRLILATGSIKDTDTFIDEMSKEFAGSRVEVNNVIDAFARLQQAGIAGAPELAKSIGEVAVLSKDANGAVDTVTNALIRMNTRGTADMRAFISAFREIPEVLALVAQTAGDSLGKAGYTVAQFVADIQSKVFTAQQIIEFFQKAVTTNQATFQAVINQNKTSITGAFNLMQQAWNDFVRELNKTNVATNVTNTVDLINSQIKNLIDTIKNNPDVVDRLFNTINSLGGAMVKLVEGLIPAHSWLLAFIELAAKAISDLPPDILAAGFLSVFFVGKLGAAAILVLTGLLTSQMSDVQNKMIELVKYVEEFLPFGFVIYLLFGRLGNSGAAATSAIFTGILVALDQLSTYLILAISKSVDSPEQQAKLKAMVADGKTAADMLGDAFKDMWKQVGTGADDTSKKVKQSFNPAAENFGVSPGLLSAKEDIDLFIQDAKQKFPELKVVAGDAMQTIVMNAELIKKSGPDAFEKMVAAAQALGANLQTARRFQQDFNDTTLQGAAQAIKVFEAQQGDITRTDQATQKWNKEVQSVTDSLQGTIDHAKQLAAEIAGNPLAAQQSQLATANDRVNKQLDDQLGKLKLMETEYKNQPDRLQKVLALEDAINQTKQTGLVQLGQQQTIAKNLFSIQEQQLVNQQKLNQLRADQAALDLKVNFNNDPTANLIAGTSAGQIMNQVLQQQIQLKQNIINYDNQILAAEQERIRLASVGAVTTELDKTIQKYQDLKNATQGAIDALSASAVATNQFWKSVGATLETGVANALTGLITKSQTLAQVGTQLFQALTAAAVKYLLQLLLIKAIMPALGGLGLDVGGAAGGAGSAGAAAIPKFATGGVLGGPTLFGIGGEAGPEGVLPLSNVNGKLGVNATGLGGAVHVHIHAIDTQTGTEFLMKNMPSIVAGLAARDRINRGKRTTQ